MDGYLLLLRAPTQWDQYRIYVPDHESQAAIMAKFRAFMLNPDLVLQWKYLYKSVSKY